MAERMIRIQTYLPPKVHAELKRRAEKHGLTLAFQIREALEAYIRSSKGEEDEPIFDPKDPIFELIKHAGHGPEDLSENHDKYLYRDPHGEESLKREPARATTELLRPVREKPATYRMKTRPSRKKGGRHK